MNENKSTESSRGTKHGLDPIRSKLNATANKKRRIVELTIDQHLAPGLRDSFFGKLTEEIMFDILGNLALDDLSQMAMTSKAMSKVIFAYIMGEKFTSDIANLLIECDSSNQFPEQSYNIGRLLKRTSFLLPVILRLKFFQQHIDKIQRCVAFRSFPIDTLPFVGAVLQTFVSGWDEGECFKVFTFMSECLFLNRSVTLISRFVSELPGTDIDNEKFLRRNLRYLFLDQCTNDYDRATWISFISNQIGTAQLAKVLLLLYGPINAQGQIVWNFAFSVRAFQQHTSYFIMLAKIISILPLVPNWSPSLSLEVLVYISNVPNCWLLRSFSSLLLPLSCVDKELVVEYFSVLYKSGRASTASLLMALAIMISPQFINNSQNGIVMEKSCIHQLIMSVINSQKLTVDRYVVVKKLWNAVLTLADDFAETAVQEGAGENHTDSIDDFQDLMDAWKELTVILMSN